MLGAGDQDGARKELGEAERLDPQLAALPLVWAQYYQVIGDSAQAKKLAGGLRLDTRAGMLKGGASGEPAIVPGDPEKSLLIKVTTNTKKIIFIVLCFLR